MPLNPQQPPLANSCDNKINGKSTTETCEPILLPSPDPIPDSGPHPVALPELTVCKKNDKQSTFKDIVYIIDSNAFYLLTETAVEYIEYAEQKLEARLKGKGEDKVALLGGLAQANLLDGIMTADITAFIPDELKDEYDLFNKLLDEATASEPDSDVPKNSHTSVYSLAAISHRIDEIIQEAGQNAEKHGYYYEHGELYTNRDKLIKKELKKYQKARSEFIQNKEKSPSDQITTLKKQLKALNDAYIVSNAHYHVADAAKYVETYWLNELQTKEKEYIALCESIEALGKLGIATPEMALAYGDIEKGHDKLAEYYDYLTQTHKFQIALRDRLNKLERATNGYAVPPYQAFNKEYRVLKGLRDKAQAIHDAAYDAIREMNNALYLIWDIDSYQPKPVKGLVRGDFPLRECIRAATPSGESLFQELRYFSFNDIPTPIKLQKEINHFSPRKETDADFAKVFGCHVTKLEVKSRWFNRNGTFNADEFRKTLKQKKITVESLETNWATWTDSVSKVLYSGELKKRLAPFDSTFAAQYMRFSTAQVGLSTKIGYAFEGSPRNPDKKKKGGEIALEVKKAYNLARGEINIVELLTGDPMIRFPEKITEADINAAHPVQYMKNGKLVEKEFRMGALQCGIYCKAYGFVGAELVIGKKLDLTKETNPATNEYQITSTSIADSLINLDMGVKAGIEGGIEVYWYPSQHAIPEFLSIDNNAPMKLLKACIKAEVSFTYRLPIRFRKVGDQFLVGIRIPSPVGEIALEGEIYPDALSAWVWQFQRLLRQCDYEEITIADKETLENITAISHGILMAQMELGLFLAHGKDRLDSLTQYFSKTSPGMIAYSFVHGDQKVLKEWVQYLLPQALGPLLYALTLNSDEITIENAETNTVEKFNHNDVFIMQQISLASIINWLGENIYREKNATRKQVGQALYCMNINKKASNFDAKNKISFIRNTEKITKIVNKKTSTKNDKLNKEIYDQKSNFYENMRNLTLINYKTIRANEDYLTNEIHIYNRKESEKRNWGSPYHAYD